MADAIRMLLIGFGNPGRGDDGLGPALAEAVEKLKIPGLTVDADYQLTVEDAAAVAECDVVLFADADAQGPEPFSFQVLEPKREESFSSHSIRPDAVLALAEDLFNAHSSGYLLGIRGYEFDEFRETLSAKAADNLAAALRFAESLLRRRNFSEMAAHYKASGLNPVRTGM